MMDRTGKIITFYSYKGGTGRSMALANAAWILASHEKRVLMIDWDLEAPGLHRYFHPFLIDPDLASTEGLIDFVWDFAMEAVTPPPAAGAETAGEAWLDKAADLTPYTVGLDYDFGNGCLDFIPAGCQGPEYSMRVNSFSWENFYSRLSGGVLLEAVRKRLKRDYDFILLDSRTGVSDTSGICTVQMPDQLVVCFTCNNQSIRGAAAVVESIREQREKAVRSKKEELQIFPVLMRVDLSEKDRLDASRALARKAFFEYPNHWEPAQRDRYWRKSEILYHSYYAYEEILAAFGDSAASDKTLLSDIETLVGHLTDAKIQELNPIPESKRLEYKARYTRIPITDLDVPDLRAPRSIELYGQVRKAKEDWETAGKPPAALLSPEISTALSYSHEVHNELIKREGFDEFIEQSARIRSLRSRVNFWTNFCAVAGIVIFGFGCGWLLDSILDVPSSLDFLLQSITVAAATLAIASVRKSFLSGRAYNELLGKLLRSEKPQGSSSRTAPS